VEIYIACFAGVVSSLLLAVVYLADRYEPEPIELIQNSFVTGVLGQLALILAAASIEPELSWSGPWLLVTVVAAGLYLPIQLRDHREMDERFDGIVYGVALVGGATCVIHLHNLPLVMAVSPHRNALGSGAEPDLRDLFILVGSPGLAAELGQGLVVVLAAVMIGAVVGTLQLRGWAPWRTAVACLAAGIGVVGGDLAAGGSWWFRAALVGAALAVAMALKRRSVFRDRPEPVERDVLVLGLKTVLLAFGAALLATVVLQAVIDQPPLGGPHGPVEPVADDRPEAAR
jgi:hypothetical protein